MQSVFSERLRCGTHRNLFDGHSLAVSLKLILENESVFSERLRCGTHRNLFDGHSLAVSLKLILENESVFSERLRWAQFSCLAKIDLLIHIYC